MFGVIPYSNYRRVFNPFLEMEKMEKRLFSNNALVEFKTDIKDNGDTYLLEADLPGFKKEDIHVDIADGTLTISAERRCETDSKDGKGNVIHSERSYGSFTRRLNLESIKEDDIEAEYKDGVLKLVLPKKAEEIPQSRRLEIK